MEAIPSHLRAELQESLSQAIQVFFDARLKPEILPASGEGKTRTRVSDRQLQLATAVLLLEVARCDFDLRADEFKSILSGVRRILGLTEDEAAAMIRFGEEEVRQSRRLHEFTQLIDSHYTLEQKKLLVTNLWQVVFADAQLVASEEYTVRKVADLLNVPFADFLEAKIEARDSFR
ncbi:MAG: TerB family tellurite resistance protein [Vicinamibacteria bacterium]